MPWRDRRRGGRRGRRAPARGTPSPRPPLAARRGPPLAALGAVGVDSDRASAAAAGRTEGSRSASSAPSRAGRRRGERHAGVGPIGPDDDGAEAQPVRLGGEALQRRGLAQPWGTDDRQRLGPALAGALQHRVDRRLRRCPPHEPVVHEPSPRARPDLGGRAATLTPGQRRSWDPSAARLRLAARQRGRGRCRAPARAPGRSRRGRPGPRADRAAPTTPRTGRGRKGTAARPARVNRRRPRPRPRTAARRAAPGPRPASRAARPGEDK